MSIIRPYVPDKLNVCLITKKFPYPGRGSDENYLWPVARGLAKRGHEVTVLSWQNPRGKAEIQTDHVRAFFLGERKGATLRQFPQLAYRKFLDLHTSKPFHIVHSLDESGFLIARERRRLKIIMAYDVSATQMAQLFSIFGMAKETISGLLTTAVAVSYKFLTTYYGGDRAILKTADGVFVATPQQKIVLERYYMYPDLKTFVVPYGLDYFETVLREKSEPLRQKLEILANAHVVVTQTDMTELTEIVNLLRAFQAVVIKKPNTRLIVIGNGPLRDRIEFETLNLVLGNKTVFTGALSAEEITDAVALSDIYVNLSSRTSGFEPTMLEAMAQKKIVIGSELSPISTIIEDRKNGFLVRPADVVSLSNLITSLLNGELPLAEIGQQAHQKVLDLFNPEKMVELLLNAYFQLVQSRPFWRRLAKAN